MKNLYLVIILIIGLISCEKDNILVEKNKPISANYILENGNSNIVYFGDTIKYQIIIKSSKLIKYINVSYFEEGGQKRSLDISDFELNTIRVDKYEDSLTFEYPIYLNYSSRWYFSPNEYSKKLALIFDYVGTTGIIQTDTLPKFIFSSLRVENHQRLYNIAAKDGHVRGYSFDHGFTAHDFMSTINCSGSCFFVNDAKNFMINIPNNDYIVEKDSSITNDFIQGWYAPRGNHYFVKVTKDFMYYNDYIPLKPSFYLTIGSNHLRGLYDQNEPKVTMVENLKVGDLYVYRYVHPFPYIVGSKSVYEGDVYGIIEVTHIEDDKLTSKNGGSDLDYIEFRTKYFQMPDRN